MITPESVINKFISRMDVAFAEVQEGIKQLTQQAHDQAVADLISKLQNKDNVPPVAPPGPPPVSQTAAVVAAPAPDNDEADDFGMVECISLDVPSTPVAPSISLEERGIEVTYY